MGCCNKTIKKTANIIKGNVFLLVGVKYAFTDGRVRVCQQCATDKNGGYWIGRTLWCKHCLCFIPAKARVEKEQCPKGFWDEIGRKE